MAVHNFSSPFLSSPLGFLGQSGLYAATTVSPLLRPRQNRQVYPATPAPTFNHGHYPQQPTRYTRVNSGSPSSGKTSVHAVIDYDDDFNDSEDYYDEEPELEHLSRHQPTVTPIQGPILVKNGSVPVVPLYSYPTINNGTLVQIPVSDIK